MIENGSVTLIASTTENPYFYVYNAILSRSAVFEFKPLTNEDVQKAVCRGVSILEKELGYTIRFSDGALDAVSQTCGGDVRKALNTLEMCVMSAGECADRIIHIDIETVEQASSKKRSVMIVTGTAITMCCLHFKSLSAVVIRMQQYIIWHGFFLQGICNRLAEDLWSSHRKILVLRIRLRKAL